MRNQLVIENEDLFNLLSKLDLNKNIITDLEQFNKSFSPILNYNGFSFVEIKDSFLNISRKFNNLSRRFNVLLSDEGKVYVNFISSLKLILNYNNVIVRRVDPSLVISLNKLNIEVPFLDYDFYYQIHLNDYMKYMSIPSEVRANMTFNSIAMKL